MCVCVCVCVLCGHNQDAEEKRRFPQRLQQGERLVSSTLKDLTSLEEQRLCMLGSVREQRAQTTGLVTSLRLLSQDLSHVQLLQAYFELLLEADRVGFLFPCCPLLSVLSLPSSPSPSPCLFSLLSLLSLPPLLSQADSMGMCCEQSRVQWSVAADRRNKDERPNGQ